MKTILQISILALLLTWPAPAQPQGQADGAGAEAGPFYPQPELCSCQGSGEARTRRFWGRGGGYCNGRREEGRFEERCYPFEEVEICSCRGQEELPFLLWGPRGWTCAGTVGWGNHGGDQEDLCVRLREQQLCSCLVREGPSAGQRLWGPEGEPCAGVPDWGLYDQQCTRLYFHARLGKWREHPP